MVILLCALTIAGSGAWPAGQSGAPVSRAPSVESPTPDVWHLEFHVSGGFAGVDQQLELASTAVLKVTDRRRGTQAVSQASAKELSRVASLISDLKPLDAGRTACRDCLLYSLTIDVNGRALAFRLDDVSLVGTTVEPLVKDLTGLLNRTLSQQRHPKEH